MKRAALLLALALVACDEKDTPRVSSGFEAVAPVPEPSGALIFAVGLALAAWRRK